jgi:1-acyl-sn-glycerol-3-phosphate acyltransferase
MAKLNLRAALILIHTLLWAAVGIFIMAINPTGRLYLWLAHTAWSRQALRMAGAPLTVKGLENIDPNRSYVVCANHQSLLDIPVLFAALPLPIRFVAKKSLFYIPIFGWSLWLAGFVPVDRKGGKRARDSLKVAARRIQNGRSVTVFPEGTRSPDGRIHEFKSGAFIMAMESGVPILPVVIKGTFEIAPKSAIKAVPHPVEVVVGAPILVEGLDAIKRTELIKHTRDIMIQMRGA